MPLVKEEIVSILKTRGEGILSIMIEANQLRRDSIITYSKNVFLPLTNICRNECGYCTFRRDPEAPDAIVLMEPAEVMRIIEKSDTYGCKEALFTFGEYADQFNPVKEALDALGFNGMLEYLYDLCLNTLNRSKLLPHSNPGVLKKSELKKLKDVNASMGLMLETSSTRLMDSVAHEKSPGKNPKLRIKTIKNAGKLKIPFTTGLLIGIGETLEERADSLLEIRRIQERYGHIQEIIIQNFKPKPGIKMEAYPEPSMLDMILTVAVAKLIFPDCAVQVPPNLNNRNAQIFLLAGADDWGGVSPLTPDYVNPEAPWPEISELKMFTEELGFRLKERLPVYPKYIDKEFLSDLILEKIF
jgi:FO synthase subunit 1